MVVMIKTCPLWTSFLLLITPSHYVISRPAPPCHFDHFFLLSFRPLFSFVISTTPSCHPDRSTSQRLNGLKIYLHKFFRPYRLACLLRPNEIALRWRFVATFQADYFSPTIVIPTIFPFVKPTIFFFCHPDHFFFCHPDRSGGI